MMRPFRSATEHELVTRLRRDLQPVSWREGQPYRLERGRWVLLDHAEVARRCLRYHGAPRVDGFALRVKPTRAARIARITLSVLRSHAIAAGLLPG